MMHNRLIMPQMWLCTISDCSLRVKAARAWNSLPPSVTSTPSLTVSKRQLKTFLFDNSFSWLYILIMYSVLEAILLIPRLEMWRSSNSTMFELGTFSTDSKFNKCFKCFVVECEFVEKSLFYDWLHMHREQESALQTNLFFFLKFNLSHKLQLLNVRHNFCSATWYIVLIWTLILVTWGNNTLSVI